MTIQTTSALAVNIAGIHLKNPIMPASGCFAFGREYAQFYNLSELSGIAIKAVSVEPREGNWTPRVAETPGGMLNSIGLQNPGLDKVIAEELKFLEQFDTKIFVNVVGNTVEDYCTVVEKISHINLIENCLECSLINPYFTRAPWQSRLPPFLRSLSPVLIELNVFLILVFLQLAFQHLQACLYLHQ